MAKSRRPRRTDKSTGHLGGLMAELRDNFSSEALGLLFFLLGGYFGFTLLASTEGVAWLGRMMGGIAPLAVFALLLLGAVFMLGAYAALQVVTHFELPLWAALAVGFVVSGVAGRILDVLLLRPLRRRHAPHLIPMIATIGAGIATKANFFTPGLLVFLFSGLRQQVRSIAVCGAPLRVPLLSISP